MGKSVTSKIVFLFIDRSTDIDVVVVVDELGCLICLCEFVRFQERNNDGGFPDGWDVCGFNREVAEGSKVGNVIGTKVFKVEYGETIWANGSGVGGL